MYKNNENTIPSVALITVNYNGYDFLKDGILSLSKMSGVNIKIFIIDNASSDDSIKSIEGMFNNLEVIKLSENTGFAKANNIGIERAIEQGYEYSLIVNNDVIVDKRMLSQLLKYADEDTITIPKIYYYDNKKLIWSAGGYIDKKTAEAKHRGIREEDIGQYDELYLSQVATGCCMLINNKIFKTIGMFDENYFMYCEDTDLCMRIVDKGYKILYVPTAKLWHKVSSSSGGESSAFKVYYIARNKLYLTSKFKDKIKLSARLYVRVKLLILLMLSIVYKKKNRNIYNAYIDYKSKKMGRKTE